MRKLGKVPLIEDLPEFGLLLEKIAANQLPPPRPEEPAEVLVPFRFWIEGPTSWYRGRTYTLPVLVRRGGEHGAEIADREVFAAHARAEIKKRRAAIWN